MLPFGWERKHELEYSESVRAYGVTREQMENLDADMIVSLLQSLKKHDFTNVRVLVLDLRQADLHCQTTKKAIARVDHNFRNLEIQLACITDCKPCDALENGIIIFRDEYELYSWLVKNNFKKNAESKTGLFTFTQDEFDEHMTKRSSLNDLIQELDKARGTVA